MNDYGIRECLVCGCVFSPRYPSQICCSEKCVKIRRVERKGRRNALAQAKRVTDLDWLNARLEEFLASRKNAGQKQAAAPAGPSKIALSSKKAERKKEDAEKFRHICVNCGIFFKSDRKSQSFCSEQCADAHQRAELLQ